MQSESTDPSYKSILYWPGSSTYSFASPPHQRTGLSFPTHFCAYFFLLRCLLSALFLFFCICVLPQGRASLCPTSAQGFPCHFFFRFHLSDFPSSWIFMHSHFGFSNLIFYFLFLYCSGAVCLPGPTSTKISTVPAPPPLPASVCVCSIESVCVWGIGRQKCSGCLKLQVAFRKRAENHRALVWKMTCTDEAAYGSWPQCIYQFLAYTCL